MTKSNFFHALLTSLTTGYILFYFSELVFWARPRPGDTLLNWAATWLAYSGMAFLFLIVIRKFNVHNLPALFLSGAFFGWLGEGVIVQTAYENLPLSISFTGLAWHALISVWWGWYGLQTALRKSLLYSIGFSVQIGVFLWLWGISWIYEEPLSTTPPGIFTIYHLLSTFLLCCSLMIAAKLYSRPFTPPRWAIYCIAGLFFLYYAFITIPAAPLSALILPLLMIIIFGTLHRNRHFKNQGDVLEKFIPPIPIPNLLTLLLIPLTASILYSLYWLLALKLPTNWLVYLITTPAGFLIFGWSVWKIWQPSSIRPENKI